MHVKLVINYYGKVEWGLKIGATVRGWNIKGEATAVLREACCHDFPIFVTSKKVWRKHNHVLYKNYLSLLYT